MGQFSQKNYTFIWNAAESHTSEVIGFSLGT